MALEEPISMGALCRGLPANGREEAKGVVVGAARPSCSAVLCLRFVPKGDALRDERVWNADEEGLRMRKKA